MKTITLVLGLTITTMLSAQQVEVKKQEVNSEINLAGSELLKYQKKQQTSLLMVIGGAGLAALGATQEDAKPIIMVGGLISSVGVVINISSLSNLKKSSKHLINYK